MTVRVKEWQGDVVFLHEVVAGAADRSYGIQVAKLAGLPHAVIERAKLILAELEAEDRTSHTRRLIDDLPLFATATRPPADAPGRTAMDLIAAIRRAQSRRHVAAPGNRSALCPQGEGCEKNPPLCSALSALPSLTSTFGPFLIV